MESSPTEKWLLKIYGCGLCSLQWDACECVPGRRGREPSGRLRLGSGVGSQSPPRNAQVSLNPLHLCAFTAEFTTFPAMFPHQPFVSPKERLQPNVPPTFSRLVGRSPLHKWWTQDKPRVSQTCLPPNKQSGRDVLQAVLPRVTHLRRRGLSLWFC